MSRDQQQLQDKVKARLTAEYGMRDAGTWLRGGKCPKCSKKELFARADNPRMVVCGRKDKCGYEEEIKELFPDLFDNWSEITKHDPSPTAAADAYLRDGRGFDLQFLRGAYSQELYRDGKTNAVSATVRFPLPNGSWWERLIDHVGRFDRKANFAPTSSYPGYQGHAWLIPGRTITDYAAADQIWIVEGIFDAVALEQGGFRPERRDAANAAATNEPALMELPGATGPGALPVSIMSCYNYPEHFLRDLRMAIASGPTPTHSPEIIFALDLGAAGTEYTRRFVKQAKAENWNANAAQVRLDDEPGAKLDWNDLLTRERLTVAHREEYRWAGDVLVAGDEREKAYLIWKRRKTTSFYFTFGGRTWWANLSENAIKEMIEAGFAKEPELSAADYETKYDVCARRTINVSCIANCTFRALFFERNETTDTSSYWLRVDRPGDYGSVKASFPGPALAGSGEFKKRLISVASGAIWTGEQFQLDRIAQRQLPVRDVTSIEFTGYCKDHGVYVFGDVAVSKGKVYRPNDDGYFDVGKTAIKLRSAERILELDYDPDKLDASWLQDVWTAWGPKGIVMLAFMCGEALVAEQLRTMQKSLGFLEVTGLAGSGKSTATEFFWKLLGREGYEGFDPAKSTQAGIARELAKVANLPVVFIEGDRTEDTPHSKRFDWEETKTLFNGRATRTRGVRNDGLETYSPPFRGAFVIVQNEQVSASRAVLERIMSIHFDKGGWTEATKNAAERLNQWPIEKLSGYIVHFARREPEILARLKELFPQHEKALLGRADVSDARLAKNHAQLLSMVDSLPIVLPDLRAEWLEETRKFVADMCGNRHQAIATDHPHVVTFWDRFDWIDQAAPADYPINHHRDTNLIAINLAEFEQRCGERRLQIAPIAELRKLLKTSKRHPFVNATTVNSVTGKTLHCWVFQKVPGK